MVWTTRKITYNTNSGYCAISPDGLTVAYGISGGFSTDGVQVIKNYGTPVETTFFISNPGAASSAPPFYGYGIALDNHGSRVSTTGIAGNFGPGSGTGHLYSIDVISTSVVTANLVSWGNSLLTDGGVIADYFTGNGSRITNIPSLQIVQPFENLVVSKTVTTTNVVASGTVTIGSTSYLDRTPPVSSGKVNTVNITVLNQRVRVSNITATNAVSNWTNHAIYGSPYLYGVCWSPELSLFVAVGNGEASTSPDGSNWTNYSVSSISFRSVCWSPELSLFVAADANGNGAFTSPDGAHWTNHAIHGNLPLFSVCWSPELSLFVAAGGENTVYTSHDGSNWTQHVIYYSGDPVNGVCWSPELSLFVMVSSGIGAFRSPDGINWIHHDVPSSPSLISVCWSPELSLFVAVENTGLGVYTSRDGINWTNHSVPSNPSLISVCWSPELSLFVAVENTGLGVYTSRDGINWTNHAVPDDTSLISVCWSPELSLFVAVSSGAGAFTSAIALPAPSSTLLTPPGVISSVDGKILIGPTSISSVDGKIGIGTNNPGSALSFGSTVNNKILTLYDVNSEETPSTAVRFYGFGVNPYYMRFQVSGDGGGNPTDGFYWYSAGVERMRIQAGTGNVGIGTNNPGSTLEVAGNVYASNALTTTNVFATTYYGNGTRLTVSVTQKSASYTVLATDYYIGVNGTGIIITLPLGSSIETGKTYVIKDESGLASVNSSYKFKIQTSGSDLIDGSANLTVTTGYMALTFLWTGSFWSVI